MTAPISNGPTITRLHHYAGRYSGRHHRPGVGSRLALVRRQNKNPLCHPMFKHLTKSGTQIVSFEFSEVTPVPEGASARLGKADESHESQIIIMSIKSDSVI